MKKTPADIVIEAFGGVRETARQLARSPNAVSLWRKPPPAGISGRVPGILHREILRLAKLRRLDISADDLIRGRR